MSCMMASPFLHFPDLRISSYLLYPFTITQAAVHAAIRSRELPLHVHVRVHVYAHFLRRVHVHVNVH